MYFWIDALMSSRIWTVILRFDSVGPVNRTSLRLKVSPPSRRKNTRKATMAAWPSAPRTPIELSHTKLPSRNVGWSTTTCVAAARAGGAPLARVVVAASTSVAAFCIFWKFPASPMRMRATPDANFEATTGNCSMTVWTWPRNEYAPRTSAADHGRHDEHGAGHARNAQPFEPADERIERIRHDDAEHQRHQERLAPTTVRE